MSEMVLNYKKHKAWAAHLHIVLQIGLTMFGCIALCFFVGHYLDLWLGTKGLMMAIFTVLGVIGGAVTVYRQIIEMIDGEKQDTKKQP